MTHRRVIEVVIEDELNSTRKMIADILSQDPEIRVVGFACNGDEAEALARRRAPDLIILGSSMKRRSGFTAAEKIMNTRPTPMVLLTTSKERMAEYSARAFSCGVLEVFDKSELYTWRSKPAAARKFVRRIKQLAGISKISLPGRLSVRSSNCRKHSAPALSPRPLKRQTGRRWPIRIVAIASSTGGPQALKQLLGELPADLKVPVLIVQHMSPGFIGGLADWLNEDSPLRVRVASRDEPIRAGQVLLAPDHFHMTVGPGERVKLVDAPEDQGLKPSANYLFSSVAERYGAATVAAVLTGMGDDGCRGLKKIKESGGTVLAQDEDTSVIFGMPGAAVAQGLADLVVPLESVAGTLLRLLAGERAA